MSRVLAVVPAHNEEALIKRTIESLLSQSVPVDILIIADNCTDKTIEIARIYPNIKVIETIDNHSKKAGALNQGIRSINSEYHYILSMDADTVIHRDLISEAIRALDRDPNLAAVCSRAGIQDPPEDIDFSSRILWHIQHLEYGAFDSYRVATLDEIKVVHGMAAVYRLQVLKEVMDYRSKQWGIVDQIWDEQNKTEDYELTICIKELGYKVTVNLDMLAWTTVPLSWKELWWQRVRWFSGGIDTLKQHGINLTTVREIFQHIMFLFMTSAQMILLALVIMTVLDGNRLVWNWITLAVYAVVTFEGIYRLRYVQDLRRGDIFIRLIMLPELAYAWFYLSQQLYAYYESFIKRSDTW